MKTSTKATTKGVFHQMTGRAKEIVGKIIKSPALSVEGKVEKVSGKVEKKIGQANKVVEK